MYVPTLATTIFLKSDPKGKRFFINAAPKSNPGVEPSADGIRVMLEAAVQAKRGDWTVRLISRGITKVKDALALARTGEEMQAWQYHGSTYDEPKWYINLGLVSDVDAKNAEYEAKRTARKPEEKTPSGKAKPSGLIR